MSGSRQKAVVLRDYQAAPDDCARALALLLKASVHKEAAHPGGPDDAKENKHVRAKTRLP